MNLNSRLIIVAAFLSLTIGLRAWVTVSPAAPARKALADFPAKFEGWNLAGSSSLSDEVSAVLKADDYLIRQYRNQDGKAADFFIAYYKVQRAGESMHSPKNCLPGSGWTPIVNDTVVLQNDSQGHPIRVNRYVIENGAERALVLYWYQASGRVIASEYWGKFYLVWDALRSGRRDGAIVRVIVPIPRNEDSNSSLETALTFARSAATQLPAYLPN
jgi:EpsI family protein